MNIDVLSGKLILTLLPLLNMPDWTNMKVLSNPRDYTTHILEEAVFYLPDKGHSEQRLWITPSRVQESVWEGIDTC